jgi:hypothetical protein
MGRKLGKLPQRGDYRLSAKFLKLTTMVKNTNKGSESTKSDLVITPTTGKTRNPAFWVGAVGSSKGKQHVTSIKSNFTLYRFKQLLGIIPNTIFKHNLNFA